MYDFLQQLHSGWAYLVILFTLLLIFSMLYFFITKKKLHAGIRKISFFTTLSYHLQFIIGLVLYFVSPKGGDAWGVEGMMKMSDLRLTALEHPIMMLTAVILFTIANAKIKRAQYATFGMLVFIVLGTLCLARIPWSAWMG